MKKTVQQRKVTEKRERLTLREKEVCHLLALLDSNTLRLSKTNVDKTLAAAMAIAEDTAKRHRQNIAKKWNCSETVEALCYEARRRGY